MLVKFLSFVISVIGTARYKAVFLSCLALVLSLTGITALVLRSDEQPRDAASTVQPSKDGDSTQNFSPQLPSHKQSAKEQAEQSESDSQNTTNSAPQQTENQPDTSTKQPAATSFDLTLGKTPSTVAANTTSDAITVTTSDNSAVAWQFSIDDKNSNNAHILTTQSGDSSSASFQIQTSKNIPSGTIITVTVLAHDTAHNLDATKTFTVTVQ